MERISEARFYAAETVAGDSPDSIALRFDLPFAFTNDSNDAAIGEILEQNQRNELLPTAFASRKLNSAAMRYSA